jgi:hypothetical protein
VSGSKSNRLIDVAFSFVNWNLSTWIDGDDSCVDGSRGTEETNVPEWICDIECSVPDIIRKSARVHVPDQRDHGQARPAKRRRNRLSADSEHGGNGDQTVPRRELTSETPTGAEQSSARRASIVADDEVAEDCRAKAVRSATAIADKNTLDAFIASLEGFVHRVNTISDEGDGKDLSFAQLKVTSNLKFMDELSRNLQVHAKLRLIASVPESLCRGVVEALDARVRATLVLIACVVERPCPTTVVSDAMLGALATGALLTIFTAPDLSRSLLVQDVLDEILLMLRGVLARIVYPSYDALYTIPCSNESRADKQAVKSGTQLGHAVSRDCESYDGQTACLDRSKTPPDSARRKSSAPLELGDEVKHLFRLCCRIFRDLTLLFERERSLTDSFVSQALSIAVSSLSVMRIVELQLNACAVVEALVSSYPEHDTSVVDELRDQLAKLPTGRRNLRMYRICERNSHIRVESALLVRVLNVVGGRIRPFDVSCSATSSPDDLRNAAFRLAVRVVDELLARIVRDREQEHRAVFQTLLEDSLELFALPEWPSADLIVQAINIRLVMMLKRGGEINVFTRCAALDTLGVIAGRMNSMLRSGNAAGYGARRSYSETNIWSNQTIRQDIVRHRKVVLTFLLGQGGADSIYGHALRFHIAQYALDDGDACADSQRDKVESDVELTRASVGDVLNARRLAAETTADALSLYVDTWKPQTSCDWNDACSSSIFISRCRNIDRQLSGIVDTIKDGLTQPEPTLRSRAIKALSLVIEGDPRTLSGMPELLPAIESSCLDVSKSVREASLDLLSRSVTTNDEMGPADEGLRLGHHMISLHDCPPDGRPTQYGPEFFERVFPIVQQRLVDSATSVRKRAVAIMRGVLLDFITRLSSSDEGGGRPGDGQDNLKLEGVVTRVCCALAERLSDREASVRDAVERSLRLALFGFNPGKMTISGPTPGAAVYASRISAVSVAIITNPKMNNSKCSFISQILHETIALQMRPVLLLVTKEVIEILHSSEAHIAELLSNDMKCNISVAADVEREVEELALRRLGCTSVLEAFAVVDATLVVPHCHALASSLKGFADLRKRSNVELLHLQKILGILELGVPKVEKRTSEFLDEVIGDVEKIVCRCPAGSIALPAIKCFCVLSRCSANERLRSMPSETARMFYDFLETCQDALISACHGDSLEDTRNAKEALPRLGLLARYGDFTTEQATEIFSLLEGLCLRMLGGWIGNNRLFLSTRDGDAMSPVANLRVRTVRALAHFLVRYKSFLPKATEILVSCLRQGQSDTAGDLDHISTAIQLDFELQQAALAGLYDLLQEEEARNLTQAAKVITAANIACSSRDTVVLAAEEDAESGFLAACAQAFVPELNRASRSKHVDIRNSVAAVFGLLARQGLVLPAKIVPALFGLLVDGSTQCRESALHVVGFLADRHPGMLSSAALSGVRSCFDHVLLTRPPVSTTVGAVGWICENAIDQRSGYAHLSQAMSMIQRDQRRGVLSSMVRAFDPRAKTVAKHSSPEPIGRLETDDAVMECTSMAKAPLSGDDESAAMPESMATTVQDDEEEDRERTRCDDGGSDDLELRAAGPEASLAKLAFFAATLATLDYACGAGIGGSLALSGGTAAAEAKLKAAREDVLELASVASRIISNSGQAVLDAARRAAKKDKIPKSDQVEIAISAAPLCMLLLLKRFLKITRWSSCSKEDRDDDGTAEACAAVPKFEMSRLPLVFSENGLTLPICLDQNIGAQLALFRELMREDLIDDSDVMGVSRRKRNGHSNGLTPRGRRSHHSVSRGRIRGTANENARRLTGDRARRKRSSTRTTIDRDQRGEDDDDNDDGYIL